MADDAASGRLVVVTGLPALDELWRRIVDRDEEGRWGSRPITRTELEGWWEAYESATDEERATYDEE